MNSGTLDLRITSPTMLQIVSKTEIINLLLVMYLFHSRISLTLHL
jgi:hypothetical protein